MSILDGQVMAFASRHLAQLAAVEADRWETVAELRPAGPLEGAPDPLTLAKAYRRLAATLQVTREDVHDEEAGRSAEGQACTAEVHRFTPGVAPRVGRRLLRAQHDRPTR